ncbi:hypothetical protein ACHHV8_26810 [Paenibacillus sp. TAB 01]|uniref:hypothetical protein n=1 Tax=Paenibacillus sp. TAB 01 TaxID=3368988 RepID=UPI0037507648
MMEVWWKWIHGRELQKRDWYSTAARPHKVTRSFDANSDYFAGNPDLEVVILR